MSKSPWIVPIVLTAAVAVAAVFLWTMSVGRTDREVIGSFVSAFAGAVALIWLVAGYRLQSDELRLQREELAATRNELAGQREQLELQNATFVLQRFESTFFELLRVHSQIVEGMDVVHPITYERRASRDGMNVLFERLQTIYGERPSYHHDENESDRTTGAYVSFYKERQAEVGHYFRHLYHVVKFVDRASVDDKHLYMDFLRAQLSSYELALLFYDCLTGQGLAKFKPLIEKYALLKNLPTELLLDPHQHPRYYEVSAFGLAVKVN